MLNHVSVLPVPHSLHGCWHFFSCINLRSDQPYCLIMQKVCMSKLLPGQFKILVTEARICISVLVRRLSILLCIVQLLADILRNLLDCLHTDLRYATRSMLMMADASPTAVTACTDSLVHAHDDSIISVVSPL